MLHTDTLLVASAPTRVGACVDTVLFLSAATVTLVPAAAHNERNMIATMLILARLLWYFILQSLSSYGEGTVVTL